MDGVTTRRLYQRPLLIAVGFAVASCGTTGSGEPEDTAASTADSPSLTLLTGKAGDMQDDLKEFRIVGANDAGCVLAEVSEGGREAEGVLVVPDGSEALGSPNEPRVELPDGTTLDQDSPLEGGGVAFSAADLEAMDPGDADLVKRAQNECQADTVVILDNWPSSDS